MKEQDYAFAVARIRANEARLLTSQDFDSLISASGLNECMDILSGRNRVDRNSGDPEINELVNKWSKDLWNLIIESVPDKEEAKVFCIGNDFFNLKAAVKCSLSGVNPENLYKYPTSLDTEKLTEAISKRDFDSLGEPYADVCARAYDIACRTENGQSADIIIDKATLEMMKQMSGKKGSMLYRIVEQTIALADIKIALRCLRTGKEKSFTISCLCSCDSIDVDILANLATESEDEFFAYLAKTDYAKGCQLLRDDTTAFEKWCDDNITELTKEAKFKFFGFEPVIAYYYAKSNEIKMLRLILCAKQSGLSEDIIKERMRQLYV